MGRGEGEGCWSLTNLNQFFPASLSALTVELPRSDCYFLPPSHYTFSCKLVTIILVLHQGNNLYLIALSILIICLLDNVWVL